MSFDFDRVIVRSGTNSVKHDGRLAQFGSADVIPLWVADMDFAAPESVTRALIARASHPIYGYTLYPESLYEALISWLQRRHSWQVEREWIMMAPGVVPSLYAAVLALTNPGDGVIVQPPVYPPFFSAVTTNGRKLVENPLRIVDGRHAMDFEHLERCASEGAKLMLLCSPHNPVGRVWEKEELLQLLDIARRHGIAILSDEIHADLIYPGIRHIPLDRLAGEDDHLITAFAPSKTFNIPGLGLSFLIVRNPSHRHSIRHAFGTLHAGNTNPFSIAAFEAAYRGGEDWLDGLMDYLEGNRDFAADYIANHFPEISLIKPEGTYLLWLDCKRLGMSDDELHRFFVHEARVGMNPGITFGAAGSGHMRLNIASPRSVIHDALERINNALAKG